MIKILILILIFFQFHQYKIKENSITHSIQRQNDFENSNYNNIRNLESICQKGFYLKEGSCFECYENCLDCDGIKCKECEPSFYPNQMNCYKCYENCLECDGNKCSKCIDGFYPNNMDCYKCYENCLKCDGNQCLKCKEGYYPYNMDCYKCHINCLECDENKCIRCNEGYLPYQMDCYLRSRDSCDNKNNYYMIKEDYIKLKNDPIHFFVCLQKENIGSGYFVNSIMENGKINYFWDKCSNNCLECYDNEENNCSLCDGINYYKLYEDKEKNNFKCYEKKDKTNYYIYEEDSIKYLRKCSDNCETCINHLSNKCTSCDNEKYFFKYDDILIISEGAQCFSQVELPNFYLYNNIYFKECNGICSTNDCDKSCANCLLTNKKDCITCNIKDNYYPFKDEYDSSNGIFNCYLKDDYPHFFLNETDKTLVECSDTCKTCINSPSYCLSCAKGAYYIQGSYDNLNGFICSFEAPGLNWVLNIEKKEWQKCNERCGTCFKQTNSNFDQQCTSCNINNNYYPYQKDIEVWNKGNNKYLITGFNCYNKDEVFANYFLEPTYKTWDKCDISCNKCEKKSNNCLECNNLNEYYYIKNHKNGSCFKNPLPGYILDSTKEFSKCYKTCKFCQTVSNSFFYMQCGECNEINYTLSTNSYERSFCIPKDNSNSTYINKQLKWYIKDYDKNYFIPNKIYDFEKFLNLDQFSDVEYTLTDECPSDKPYLIYSIRQCVSKCSNPNDLIEYGLFFAYKPLYVYNNICYDECPYGSYPDNKTMTCVEENKYVWENLIVKEEFEIFYQKNIDIYLSKSANNTIFQIVSTQFTNYFYNSSTNNSWKYEQNMPVFNFDKCLNLLTEKYNYSKVEIHIGIFQNNDLKKDNFHNNFLPLTAVNSTYYKFFLSNGTMLNYSICNGMNTTVQKPINTTLLENFSISKKILDDYNFSIYDDKNDIFNDICIPMEINGKDLSILTRNNKLKSKIKLCDEDCDFISIDYERNYSICECKIKEEKEMNIKEFAKENFDIVNMAIALKGKSNFVIFKCLNRTKFDKKNYVFYLSLIFSIIHFVFLFFYFIEFKKKLQIDFNNEIETKNESKENLNEVISKKQQNNNNFNYININNFNNIKVNKSAIYFHSIPFSDETTNGNDVIENNQSNSKKNTEEDKKNEKEKRSFKRNFKRILIKNLSNEIPLKKKFEFFVVTIQMIIFLIQSFLFINGLLSTEEYITKRFDEKNKIGFLYILTNELNKYWFISLFFIISFKIYKILFNGIEFIKEKEIDNENTFEIIVFKKKLIIIFFQMLISTCHIFFTIFIYVFGNIYPNNKNFLLISECISILFIFLIFFILILISSLIMSIPFISKYLNSYEKAFNEIGNNLLKVL